MELLPLTPDTVADVAAVYAAWEPRVSYYFPIDLFALQHTLFAQPEVHPAAFEMVQDASVVAIHNGQAVGWIQAGYISDIVASSTGETDALIRGLMFADGRADVGQILLDKALKVLAARPVHAWRAFEHSSGYTFATGIGQVPHRMTETIALLTQAGFQPEATNFVYATKALVPRPTDKKLEAIEFDKQLKGWSEPRANVDWDRFIVLEQGKQVGYAVVVPVSRLTQNENEHTLFVKGIAVEPEHHRRGIGHLIMTALWEHYQTQGIDRIILNTDVTNERAQRFYEAVGFDLPDKTSPYITEKLA